VTELFAYIGEDELKPGGEIGLKQAVVPVGIVPLVAVHRDKIDRRELQAQLQRQADAYGKTIRLVRFVEAETLVTITPRPQG
jgi:hypothetical protein